MNWKTCIKTPAGEIHAEKVETADNLEEHALQAPLRIGFAYCMTWLDGHTSWGAGTPTTDPPVKGEGNWLICMHPFDVHCQICMPSGPEVEPPVKAAPAPAPPPPSPPTEAPVSEPASEPKTFTMPGTESPNAWQPPKP